MFRSLVSTAPRFLLFHESVHKLGFDPVDDYRIMCVKMSTKSSSFSYCVRSAQKPFKVLLLLLGIITAPAFGVGLFFISSVVLYHAFDKFLLHFESKVSTNRLRATMASVLRLVGMPFSCFPSPCILPIWWCIATIEAKIYHRCRVVSNYEDCASDVYRWSRRDLTFSFELFAAEVAGLAIIAVLIWVSRNRSAGEANALLF